MSMKVKDDHAAASGTMYAGRDADRRITAARAQAELIDILARLVLAAVENESAAKHSQQRRDDAGG